MKNSVFIGCSLDGQIADKNGGLEWLDTFPNPEQIDMGYHDFTNRIDAIVMGRVSFETVCGFGIEWPYKKPVFVLSRTLKEVPNELRDKVFLVNGTLQQILFEIHSKGYKNLYIDGGKTIQSFLREDLIDEMIITTIPVLLGGGHPLFSELDNPLKFECIKTQLYLGKVVQSQFIRSGKA